MKKIFYLFGASFVLVLASCNGDSKSDIGTTKEMITDTSATYKNTVNTDTAKTVASDMAEPSTSLKEESKSTDTKKSAVSTVQPVQKQPKSSQPVENTPVSKDTVAVDNKTTTTTEATQKKGMSNSAKDAIIGGAVGAVGGAIISKKKGKGAIIGGVLGAGAGYILGKKKDKKDTIK